MLLGFLDPAIPDDLQDAMVAFERMDLDQIHPDRVLDYLPDSLSQAARQRLVNTSRLRGRLEDLTGRKLDLPPLTWDDFQSPAACIALLDVAELQRAGHLAAATFEGDACRRLIFKEERQKLDALLPDNTFGFIIQHREFAWPRTKSITIDQLCACIQALGQQLLQQFVQDLRPALAERMKLKLPVSAGKVDHFKLSASAASDIMAMIARELYGYGRY